MTPTQTRRRLTGPPQQPKHQRCSVGPALTYPPCSDHCQTQHHSSNPTLMDIRSAMLSSHAPDMDFVEHPPITRNMHRQRRETNAPCYSSTSHRHLTHRDITPPFEHARSPEIRRNGTGEAHIRPACPIGLYAIRLQAYSCCVYFTRVL